MRRNFISLLFATTCALFFISCQKEVDEKVPGNPPVSSDDPVGLSAAIKVWHGQRTPGAMPVPVGSGPVLDPTANPEVRAFAGRYAIIKPEVLSGEVAGYYVSVVGANQHFKVDYTKPRNIAGKIRRPGSRRDRVMLRPQDGNADSSIVIVLPPNINAPDTFCVTYSAYDSLGGVGPAVTTCIIVSTLGGDATSGWIQNDWKMTAYWWESAPGVRDDLDTIIYNKWFRTYTAYTCFTDSFGSYLDYAFAGDPIIVGDSAFYRKSNLRFATNGAFDFKEDVDEKYLDLSSSTCSVFSFMPVENYMDAVVGGWSYNSTTGKLLLIYEFDYTGMADPEVWEVDVIKVNNNHWLLKDSFFDDYYRWER